MIKRILLALVALLLMLAAALAINTLRQGSRQLDLPPLPLLEIDKAAASAHLGEAVSARTVSSRADASLNADQFAQLHAMLQARYPKAHASLKREPTAEMAAASVVRTESARRRMATGSTAIFMQVSISAPIQPRVQMLRRSVVAGYRDYYLVTRQLFCEYLI